MTIETQDIANQLFKIDRLSNTLNVSLQEDLWNGIDEIISKAQDKRGRIIVRPFPPGTIFKKTDECLKHHITKNGKK